MSKLKISFSTVMMLLLLSIFAAAASAAAITPTSTHPAEGITNDAGKLTGIYVGDRDNSGNVSTHRTHGNFQNNTNSCANCHSTHNGENEQLLMKSGEYELCMACHDGTMGFYDVTKGSAAAGVFDETADSHMSASMHNVNSAVQISAAPGALTNVSTDTFECSSCHNPHGSSNDRLLNSTVAGKQYGYNYLYALNGYTEIITKVSVVPTTQASIKLALTPDPAYTAINALSGSTGLKITTSNGPLDDGTVTNHQYKLNYSEYCSACHDDYLKNRENGPRADNIHYTHTTNSAKQGRSCVACHYAHGTDITTLRDTAGNTIADLQASKGWSEDQAKEYMKDVRSYNGGSSALKRFTNMAVCWACHQSTHKIDSNVPSDYSSAGKTLIK